MSNLNSEVGGYFSFEFEKDDDKFHYHKDALKLNSARNCLEIVFLNFKVNKIFIPYYNCTVMLEPIMKTGIDYQFYSVDEKLEIKSNITLKTGEYILYVNYFGVKSKYIEALIGSYGEKLIIDNSQSFFTRFQDNILSIYSPRKFFGVSDGGYLTGKNVKGYDNNLEYDLSIGRVSHLIGRIENTAEKYYTNYRDNDASLSMADVKKMSKFTHAMLSNINYGNIRQKRNRNFKYLHKKLVEINAFEIDLDNIDGPLDYPFLNRKILRDMLISNKVYVAKYWEGTLGLDGLPEVEKYLINNLTPLPIDQRYNINDMEKIVALIKGYI